MTEHVKSDRANGVLTLTLDRPEKKNALTPAMYGALAQAIDGAADDPAVRCILIQSEGDIFTAGNDLADFTAASKGGDVPLGAQPLLVALARAKTPLVAAVHGKAVGVGATLLLHCDLVFLADDAQLSTPFVNLALVPEAASSLLLPARIGHVRAFAMFVLGEVVDAQKALAWGLANAVVPRAELRAKARAAAEAVAQRPPAAVALTKSLMREPTALTARMDVETAHFIEQLRSPEAREAFTAFAEKRAPDFAKLR
ncbi:MAG TPA: enoyl-CoA hydratase [Polyangiales bacterium]|nr:enoyl-CoA hydratase [Polyangiales bacterium]